MSKLIKHQFQRVNNQRICVTCGLKQSASVVRGIYRWEPTRACTGHRTNSAGLPMNYAVVK